MNFATDVAMPCRTVTGVLQPLDSFAMAANLDSSEQVSAAASDATVLDTVAISLFAAAIFFFNLWRYGFWEPDEARYGEIAREMVNGGSWLIPHLNYVIYVE